MPTKSKSKPKAQGAAAVAEATTGPEIYCVKCKTKTGTVDARIVEMKNGRPATTGECRECGTSKYRIGAMAIDA